MNTDNHEGWAVRTALGPLLALSFGFAACSLPTAQSDPTRFFVLSATDASVAAAPAANAPTVRLRPVELENYMRARPLIVRRGDNEIEFRDFARWGEPLEQGIGRVLREELLARGAAKTVVISGLRAAGAAADFELSVRVLDCEGATNGGVTFRATWELTAAGDKAGVVAQGDFHPTDLKWDGKNEATLAAQISRAVAGLAADIGAALPKKG